MYYYVTWVLFLSAVVQSSQNFEDNLVKRMVKECLVSRNAILCFANKAAKALERSMDWNVHFFDGVTFERNKEKAPESEARARTYGFGRLFKALNDFLNTHTLTLDLTKGETAVEARGGGGGGEGGGGGDEGGGFGGYKNAIKKEKKYMQYAFMVLLGIFGLTGPLMMKTLAIMAAKALLARSGEDFC
ncbi:uncharacterized protein LOC123013290 [Tribolium madens]|uniref:uncharacterized protein LOC123013290 n=1 Tax=Tribolium madens TaxID=41895 RepID=UPI001CF730CA|nr:uncharacterized protein LOC123013290 [Tribolium madens]